jgi:hypothetical protein
MGFMPTLGRPHLVEEVIAMWELQTYQDRELLIYDTANQMPEISGETWRIIHQGKLPFSMGTTCNVGIRMSDAPLIARIDDDDHYFPWHLEACVEALQNSAMSCPYCTWDGQYGRVECFQTYSRSVGPSGVAYAGAWAFTREAFEAIGGYKESEFREDECEFRDRMVEKYGPPGDTTAGKFRTPSYLYAANHVATVHYGQCTDEQRREYQRQDWPKVEKIEPRLPSNFMDGISDKFRVHPRRF